MAKSQKSRSGEGDILSPERRAEDILLGALGYGEDAQIVSVQPTAHGYSGVARWSDGEAFNFQSDEEPTDLERWALEILQNSKMAGTETSLRKNNA